MTSGRDSFGPKIVVGLVLHHHSSSGFNQGSILPFGDSILLRSLSCGVLALNAFFAKKVIQRVVLEFRPIVAPNCDDLGGELALNLIGEFHHRPLRLTLVLEEEAPTIP